MEIERIGPHSENLIKPIEKTGKLEKDRQNPQNFADILRETEKKVKSKTKPNK